LYFFFFLLSTFTISFWPFFVLFLPFCKEGALEARARTHAAKDLFLFCLLFSCILPCFVYFCFSLIQLFVYFLFFVYFFRHILHQVFAFDVQVLLIVPRQHQRAGTSIGIYPDHFQGVRGEGSLTKTPWSPTTSW